MAREHVFYVFSAIADFELWLISEHTHDGIAATGETEMKIGPVAAETGDRFHRPETHQDRIHTWPSRMTNQPRQNNGLQSHHCDARSTLRCLNVILRTNLPMTPGVPVARGADRREGRFLPGVVCEQAVTVRPWSELKPLHG